MYKIRDIDVSSFLRQDPTFQKIIQGFFGLNYLEFVTLCSLYQLERADAEQIGHQLGNAWPRNKINAALKKIRDLSLASRERDTTGTSSGYRFIYVPVDVDWIKEEILQVVDNWLQHAKIELEDLRYHLSNYDTSGYADKKSKRDEIRKEWFDEE